MTAAGLDVVTGAFGFTGRYIAGRLLALGRRVRTLTGHPNRPNPFGPAVEVAPLDFDDPAGLIRSLRGADTLYNTYWVRFPYRGVTFETAVRNSLRLVEAAREAGVQRVVHISITKPSPDSPFPYFRGKARVEQAVMGSGLSHAIIRPTVIFGPGDILFNNIAWMLRRFPIFLIPGRGDYRLQPVYVDDVARVAVDAGQQDGNVVVEASGPELYAYKELVALMAEALGRRVWLVPAPPEVALFFAGLIGRLVHDIVLTRDEVYGLMAGLLVASGKATGSTRFSVWVRENAGGIGLEYASELRRHYA
jgi:NADH dehydrogenase